MPFNSDVELLDQCDRRSREIRLARLIGYPSSAGGPSHGPRDPSSRCVHVSRKSPVESCRRVYVSFRRSVMHLARVEQPESFPSIATFCLSSKVIAFFQMLF